MDGGKKQRRPYVTVTIDFYDHPKTKRLAKALGVHVGMAGYHLQRLWMWAWRFAPEGDLIGVSEDEIADAAGLKRTDAVLKLVLAGWLDSIDGGYAIHDWFEHSGMAFEKKRKHRDYMRESRAKAKGCELTVNSRELTVNSRELTVNSRERPTTTATTTTTELKPPTPFSEPELSAPASPEPVPSFEDTPQESVKEPRSASKRTRVVPKVPSERKIEPRAVLALWNENRHPKLAAVQTLSAKRLKLIEKRLEQFPDLESWRAAVRNLSSSSFHLGGGATGWLANFDWLLSEGGIKAFEGLLEAPPKQPRGITSGYLAETPTIPGQVIEFDIETARKQIEELGTNEPPKRRRM